MTEELRWPSEADLKRVMPDLTTEQIRQAGKRLLESAEKHRGVIEMVEKSSRFTDEDLEVRYS